MSGEPVQVGTFELLKERGYLLDANGASWGVGCPTEVVVQPGKYPIYRLGVTYYWMMSGRINMAAMRLGGGLFTMSPGFDPSGPAVTFPSRFFSEEELLDLSDPGRFRITLESNVR